MTEQQTYLLKEFDKLNAEIAKLLEETRTREKYSLTIIAAVSAWVYTACFDSKNVTSLEKGQFLNLVHALSWIPLLTTVLYGVSVLLLYKNISWIGQYLLKIENIFLDNYNGQDNLPMGWEKHFERANKKKYFVFWTWGFWIVQILLALFIVYKSYSLTAT